MPSPTYSAEPMRARTMLWQNASAWTVATMTPSSPRRNSKRCSSLMVVAPSRGLQKDRKFCRPSSCDAPWFSRSTSSGFWRDFVDLHRPVQITQGPVQGTAEAAQHGDGGIKFVPARQPQPLGFGEVQVDHLAPGVHAGVGPPGNCDPHLAPDQQLDGFLQDALDRAQAGLQRPPAERAAVVRNVTPDTQKPA